MTSHLVRRWRCSPKSDLRCHGNAAWNADRRHWSTIHACADHSVASVTASIAASGHRRIALHGRSWHRMGPVCLRSAMAPGSCRSRRQQCSMRDRRSATYVPVPPWPLCHRPSACGVRVPLHAFGVCMQPHRMDVSCAHLSCAMEASAPAPRVPSTLQPSPPSSPSFTYCGVCCPGIACVQMIAVVRRVLVIVHHRRWSARIYWLLHAI